MIMKIKMRKKIVRKVERKEMYDLENVYGMNIIQKTTTSVTVKSAI